MHYPNMAGKVVTCRRLNSAVRVRKEDYVKKGKHLPQCDDRLSSVDLTTSLP